MISYAYYFIIVNISICFALVLQIQTQSMDDILRELKELEEVNCLVLLNLKEEKYKTIQIVLKCFEIKNIFANIIIDFQHMWLPIIGWFFNRYEFDNNKKNKFEKKKN